MVQHPEDVEYVGPKLASCNIGVAVAPEAFRFKDAARFLRTLTLIFGATFPRLTHGVNYRCKKHS
jgi:hypothetical protein